MAIVDNDPDDDDNLLHSELSILDSDGASVLATGDNTATADANCGGAVLAPTTGTYYVRLSNGNLGGGDTAYRLVVLVDGALVGPEPPPPQVIFADGFESGDTEQWSLLLGR